MSAKGTASETAPGSPPTDALAQLDVQGKEEPASPSADAESSEPRSATSPPDASTEVQTSRDSAEPHVGTVELPAAGAPDVTAAEADVTEPEAVDDDEAALAAAQGAQEEDEAARDPAVEQLRALFPNVDLEIVEAVLAASGGSLDEATEQLLVLSDPTYKPDPVEVCPLSQSIKYGLHSDGFRCLIRTDVATGGGRGARAATGTGGRSRRGRAKKATCSSSPDFELRRGAAGR